jgi:hypothetical protein
VAVADTSENQQKCICMSCPSYPRGGDPILYCARGKSPKHIEQVRCTCPGCPVWHENDLAGLYFCVSGKAP